MKKVLFVFAVISIITVACSVLPRVPKDVVEHEAIGNIPNRTTLPQGWDDQRSYDFWFTSQGSRIIPYTWFTHLEQPDNQKSFRAAEYLESFGYLPEKKSANNPSGLPIGFVITRAKKMKNAYMGFTCAACHTNQINYKGQKILVDGAPTLADFVAFLESLTQALEQTNTDKAKFDRFAEKVLMELDGKVRARKKKKLREALAKTAEGLRVRIQVNRLPDDYPADFTSYARLDAFGNIENAGSAFALRDPSNRNAPSAPVSYPFLWGTHQSDVVQWDASAPNVLSERTANKSPRIVGPLIRNVGEVVGVFGGLEIKKGNFFHKIFGNGLRYKSTIDYQGLGQLESYVKTLMSPQWPKSFPKINKGAIEEGRRLYKLYCGTEESPKRKGSKDYNAKNCHQIIPREDEYKPYISVKTPLNNVGTDIETAWQIQHHEAKSLFLKGRKAKIVVGSRFEEETEAINIPVNGVVGLVLSNPRKALKAGLAPYREKTPTEMMVQVESFDLRDFKDSVDAHSELKDENLEAKADHPKSSSDDCCLNGLVYKARPLNGIWATAPYLHNGSVPNLWELLKDPKKRMVEFHVGSREFDPKNVGFDTKDGPSVFKVYKDGNKKRGIMPGNSNRGHDYGTDLEDEEKWQLIEFMKTL